MIKNILNAIFIQICQYFPPYLQEKNVTFLVLYVIGIIKPWGDKTHSPLSYLFGTMQILCWQQAQKIVSLIIDTTSAGKSWNDDLLDGL